MNTSPHNTHLTNTHLTHLHATPAHVGTPARRHRRAILASTGAIAAAALLGSAAMLTAGPLTPPPGAPTPTYKTLQEVEPRIPISSAPFVITQRGSYYLTNNIFATATTDAITVFASNVTIDLNGYTIGNARTGIFIEGSVVGPTDVVRIHNGIIRDTAGSGIFTNAGGPGSSNRIEVRNLRIINHTDAAIALNNHTTIDNVTTQGAPGSTSSTGLIVGFGSRITNAIVDRVALVGITAGEATHISDTTITNTGGDGLRVGSRSKVTDVTVTNAAGNGMAHASTTTSAVTFERCHITNVGLNGIQLDGTSSFVTQTTVTNIGNSSTFGGPISSGVLMNGSDSRVDSSRFYRCGYPVFITSSATFNTVLRSAANFCNNSFTNTGNNSNLIAPTPAIPVGAWDNTFQ